ncbi:MAG TPA: exo-beta-N-acetylmuramidase NamZ domain-containing protein, partial [Chthoniobacterales bacterium]
MCATGNKKCLVLFLVMLALVSVASAAVKLGIDVLADNDYSLLAGKRVGLITNQTGVNAEGVRTRVLLRKNCNLVALYTPEHGLDGREKAGRYVRSRRDPVTGLIAHSLYGPTRKPTAAMLRGVDVLVFDLQDIGCRSYTYIST